jgi:hypothetical protein
VTIIHGKEIKEPEHVFTGVKPLELCQFFQQYLPERLDSFTVALPPITARFVKKNNTYVSFIFDEAPKGTKVSLAEYNAGAHTGAISELKDFYAQAQVSKKDADKVLDDQRKEADKARKQVIAKARKHKEGTANA